MPTFEVCVTSTLEIYAAIEAEDAEQADTLAYNMQIIEYANQTVGVETGDGEIEHVCGHSINEVVYVREKGGEE